MGSTEALQARPRQAISTIAPYVPGRTHDDVRRALGLTEVVKLASNENPFGPSPRVVDAIRRAAPEVGRYPDGASVDLRSDLARCFGVAHENVVTGNGSDELILLLALAYLDAGDEAVLARPPYGIHRTAVLATGGVPVTVPLRDYVHDLEAMAAAVTTRTRLVFLANPHNPTGTLVDGLALRRFVEVAPASVLVVVDEAYFDFVDPDLRHTARDLLDLHPNVVTLRTFSKAYGMAGLRAGYAVAHADVVATLDRIRPPFGLNSLAQAAARAALTDREHLAFVIEATRCGRSRLLELASRLDLEAIPSQANFVLMRVEDPAVVMDLMAQGVIVRPGENLGMPGWIRVSVGLPEEIDRFEQFWPRSPRASRID
jgi:histidinol-phosphate aminotransferase